MKDILEDKEVPVDTNPIIIPKGVTKKEPSWGDVLRVGFASVAIAIPATEFSLWASNLLATPHLRPEIFSQTRLLDYSLLTMFGVATGIIEGAQKGSNRFTLPKIFHGAYWGFASGIAADGLILSVLSALQHTPVDQILSQDGVASVMALGISGASWVGASLVMSRSNGESVV